METNRSAVVGAVAGLAALIWARWWMRQISKRQGELAGREILAEVLERSVPVVAAQYLAAAGGEAMTVECLLDGRQLVVTCDPRAAEHIFHGPGRNKYRLRPAAADGLRQLGMHHAGLIWNNDLPSWTQVRNCFKVALNQDALTRASDVACQESAALLDISLEAPLNLLDVARKVTFRVALCVFFGIGSEDFKPLGIEEDAAILAIVAYFKAWEYLFLRPQRHWDAFLLEKHRAAVAELRRHVRALLAAAQTLHNPSSVSLPRTPIFIDRLQAACREDPEMLEQSSLEMLLAGTDTSSVTAYYALLGVAGDAQLQQDLHSELVDAQRCPGKQLLDAVINETLRFKPVGPVVLREAECRDLDFPGVKPGGVQAGAAVLVHLAEMNLRSELWGDDASDFRPSRFLADNCGQDGKFWPFGDGPKGCIGMHLGRREVKAILETVVRGFELEVEGVETLGSLQTHWDIANQPDNPALIRLRRRFTQQ